MCDLKSKNRQPEGTENCSFVFIILQYLLILFIKKNSLPSSLDVFGQLQSQ